jgi:hypothetical protein
VRVSLTAVRDGGLSVSPAAATVDASGRFTVAGVMPGAYRTSVGGLNEGWAAKSALVGTNDILDSPLVLAPSDASVETVLTLTDRPARLSGTFVDASGLPATDYVVVAFAADRRFWTPASRRVQSVRPNAGGRFAFASLPPGEYWLCALTDVEPSDLADGAFLESLERSAVRVTLAEGEQKSQDLRIARAPLSPGDR